MNLFVSGPLMFRDLIKAVAGKTFPAQSGLLRGYAQFKLKDEGQSAMIPFPDRVVDGVVYFDVDKESLIRLDAFQGKRFEREEVSVEAENGEWLDASAYCLKLSRKGLLSGDEWDEDEYRETDLKKVLKSWNK
ncbi:MAG: gamma-glutamylcyclotransferase family protein [bacterium]